MSTVVEENLLSLLTVAAGPEASKHQSEITKAFTEFNNLPDAHIYLAELILDNSISLEVRGMAALLLKNRIKRMKEPLAEHRSRLLECLVSGIDIKNNNSTGFLKKTIGLCITNIFSLEEYGGVLGWPELVPTLLKAPINENLVSTLEKICQDSPDELMNSSWSEQLINHLMTIIEGDNPLIVSKGLSCLNQFILVPNDAMEANLPNLLTRISRLTDSPNVQIQKQILGTLNLLTFGYPVEMASTIPSVIEFMLRILEKYGNPLVFENFEENLALDACDYFYEIFDKENDVDIERSVLVQFLPRLIAALLDSMTYSEDDLELGENDDNNFNQPDDLSHIIPRHHRKHRNRSVKREAEEVDEDEDQDEKEGLDEYGSSGWNLRKCAANTFERLSVADSSQQIVDYIVSLVNHKFSQGHKDWRLAESGIMAIGALAEGSKEYLKDQLPDLLDFLCIRVGRLPLVRSSASWVISRYADLISQDRAMTQKSLIFLVEGASCETSKRVQRVSCAFLQSLLAYIPQTSWSAESIVKLSLEAFKKYPVRNQLQLCDLITFVADERGFDEVSDELFLPLLEQLLGLWTKLANSPSVSLSFTLLYPLIECLSSISMSSGSRIPPESGMFVVSRVIDCCFHYATLIGEEGELLDSDHTDFLVAVIDLISGLINIPPVCESLIVSKFGDRVLLNLIKSDDPAILQSVFAFLGDTVKNPRAFEMISSNIRSHWYVLKLYIRDQKTAEVEDNFIVINDEEDNIEEYTDSVGNNAIWVIGELIYRYYDLIIELLTPDLTEVLISLVRRILAGKDHHSLTYQDNVVVTVGRLFLKHQSTHSFENDEETSRALKWVLEKVCDGEERYSAFLGYLKHVKDVQLLRQAIDRYPLNESNLPPEIRHLLLY